MKKIYLLLTLFAFVGMVSCDEKADAGYVFDPEKDIVVDRGADPGAEYAQEAGVKYVNVYYYVPKGMVAVNDWHWRVSGIVTHIQDFFADNLKRYYQMDKTFEVIRNVANSKYVKIHYLQGNADLTFVENWQEEDPTWFLDKKAEVIADIDAYWKANPTAKTGSHHLIFMPNNALKGTYDPVLSKTANSYAFLPFDKEFFDIKYFDYSSTRNRYLKDLSTILYSSGTTLGALENMNYATQNFTPLQALEYISFPEKTRLTEADVLSLNQSEAFNPRSGEEKYGAYPHKEQLLVQDVKMESTATFITLTCQFISAFPVAHLLAFEDPWKSLAYNEPAPEVDMKSSRASENATIFYSEELQTVGVANGMYLYQAVIRIPVAFVHNTSKTPIGSMEFSKSEFRLKFLLKNGYVFPALDNKYYADAVVYADRYRYQFYWVPGVESGTFQPYLLTDLRDHNEIVYTPEQVVSSVKNVVDGNLTTTWIGTIQGSNLPEVTISMGDVASTVDGIRIWAPGDQTPLRVTIYATAGGVESIVADKRLIPGDEAMYKYIGFDRKENVSQLKVRVDKASGGQSSIAEIEVYRKRDN